MANFFFFFGIKTGAIKSLQAKRIAKDKLNLNLAKKHNTHKLLGIVERMDPDTEASLIGLDAFKFEVQSLGDDCHVSELNEGNEESNSFFLFILLIFLLM